MELADFPADVNYVYGVLAIPVVPPVTRILAAGENKNGTGVIYDYQSGFYAISYEAPYEISTFEEINAINEYSVFAVGSKTVGGRKAPYMVTYEPVGETWNEVKLTSLPGQTISAVYPVNDYYDCWFLVTNHTRDFYGKHAGFLILRQAGRFRIFDAMGQVTAGFDLTGKTLYALEYAGDNIEPKKPSGGLGPGYKGRGKLYISPDLGASWSTEFLPFYVGGRKVHAAEILTVHRGVVFFKFLFEDGGIGLVKRAGGPGLGEYGLVFLSYTGPYFRDLRVFRFNETDYPYGISTDALGVGSLTTVIFEQGNWLLENLDSPLEFYGLTPTRENGFVASALNVTFGTWELLYHP